MKKTLLFGLAIYMSNAVSAQTMVKEMDGADTRFIPGNYMKNGQAAIYFSSDEYGYTDEGQQMYNAEIYDFELNPLKSFNFQILHPYTIYERRASSGSKELSKVITDSGLDILGLPAVTDMQARKEAFIAFYYDQFKDTNPALTMESLTAGCRVEGSTIYISLPFNKESNYYQYGEYLKTVEVYLDSNDRYGYRYTYAATVPVYNGEWTVATWYDVPMSNFCTPRCTDVAGMNHWNGGVYLPFSQTFFNDDEKFEYVRYNAEIVEGYGDVVHSVDANNPLYVLFGITENDRDGDGEEDFRSTHFGVKRTALEVVTEDGTTLYTFPLPETCEGNPTIEFFKSDNSILAQIGFNWKDENGRYMHTVRFYRIDKSAGVTKVIREENRMSATPNPVSAGTPIRMTIPDGKGNREVSVNSLNGEQVYSTNVESGITDISIPTQNLLSGIYLFTLTEDGNIIDSCKMIVR